jgi:hypothetical protein
MDSDTVHRQTRQAIEKVRAEYWRLIRHSLRLVPIENDRRAFINVNGRSRQQHDDNNE